MFSDLQNVLFPPLGRESGVGWKETHDGHFPWHELPDLSGAYTFVWIFQHCKQRIGERERDGRTHSFGGLCWEMVSHAEICLHRADPRLRLLCHPSHHYHKGVSLEPKAWLLQPTLRNIQLHLLAWLLMLSATAVIHHLVGHWKCGSGAVCCRDVI